MRMIGRENSARKDRAKKTEKCLTILDLSADKVKKESQMDAKTLTAISYGAIGVVVLVLVIFAVKEIVSVSLFKLVWDTSLLLRT